MGNMKKEKQLKHLERVLNEVQHCRIEKPHNYYKAYRDYTVAYGIEILNKMLDFGNSNEDVKELLDKYLKA